MIKLFGKGLGLLDHPFDISSPVKISSTGLPGRIISDTSSKTDSTKSSLNIDGLYSHVQVPNSDLRKNKDETTIARQIIDHGIKPQVFSAESGRAPFETLFHDFNLEAYPFYNFWAPDELTNENDVRGDRKLEDLPRFIKVIWNIAPDLKDPEEKAKPKTVDSRHINPVIFSRELERPVTHTTRGITFTPDHLQITGFSSIKSMIANGHMSPGVLETIVEMPLHNTGVESSRAHAGTDPINMVDEDAFLTDTGMNGISIHELQGQISQVTNGIASMNSIASDGVSSNMTQVKETLVDGKTMISKSIQRGGFAQISSIHPSSPTLSLQSRTATPARPAISDPVVDMTQRISQPEQVTDVQSTAQVKVKFFNPAIGGLISKDKVNFMSEPHHVETLSAIAPSLHSLEVLSRTDIFEKPRHITIPSLPSPKLKPLEYTGYIIEKYKRQKSGAFTKVEEIDIPSREVNLYIDTKILYGEVYRYRIKAVLRWTRPGHWGIDGPDPLTQTTFGSHTANFSDHKSSYFVSEWSHKWAYGTCIDDQPPGPPDELTVRPESHKKRIVVTFKLPENSQKDILKMRLFRKFQDENGRDISHWQQIKESWSSDKNVDFAPNNVIFFDEDVEFFQKHKTKHVYAAQCISRHGEDSVLSEQLATRLNEEYFTRGEFPVDFVSSAGVRLDYYGAFGTIPNRVTKTEVVVSPAPTRNGKPPGITSLVIAGRNTIGNASLSDANYLCRVQSLDTGESIDIPINLSILSMQPRQTVSKFDFFIPQHSISNKNSNNFDSESDARLNEELKKLQDAALVDDRDEENEVLVYDRSSPGERW